MRIDISNNITHSLFEQAVYVEAVSRLLESFTQVFTAKNELPTKFAEAYLDEGNELTSNVIPY